MSRNVLSRTNSSILFRISEVRKITQKEGAAIKIAKEVAREAAKEEKVAKKVARESAKEEKVAKKVARESAKEAAKEEKIIAERASKEKKRADREEKIATRKVEKIKQRELTLAIRHHVKEKYIALTEKQLQKKNKKFEVQTQTLSYLIPAARDASNRYPNGFTTKQFAQLYITRYGNINPYTLEPVDEKYDIAAGIRGIMYETSPSSEQHWFRYGMQKVREQVAPWVFVNKQLAVVNDAFKWKVTTTDMAKARRRSKGLWSYMSSGSHAFYDWSLEEYGPLPTEEILKEAALGRKVGARGRKQHDVPG